MKKLYTFGLSLLLCLFFTSQSNADTLEVAGADISYKWKNDSICVVQLDVYTICNGTTLNDVRIKISSPQSGFTSYSKKATISGGDIMQIWCDPKHQQVNSCTNANAFQTGFRKYTAEAEFNLRNSTVCEYYFSWDTCCRTKIITTGAARKHFYIDAYMRHCNLGKTGIPKYDSEPFFYAKTDSCNVKKNLLLDYKNFSYELTAPLQAFNDEIEYANGYSVQNPFVFSKNTSCNGIKIDEHGNVIFNPSQPDVSPVAFKLMRLTKDTVTGYSIRDVIYMAMEIPDNRNPIISGINGTNQVVKEFIVGQSVCFTINSFDIDQDDSVTITATQKPGSATFTIEKDKRFPKGTFCWMMDASYISTKPYELRVVAEDNVMDCKDLKLNGKTERIFQLYVCEHNNQHSCNVGISNSLQINRLQLYPQPAQKFVYVDFSEKQLGLLQLTDMTGRIFTPAYFWEGNKLRLDLQSLKPGHYILKIATSENIFSGKLLIQP